VTVESTDATTTDGLLQTRATQTTFDNSEVLHVGFGDVTVVLCVCVNAFRSRVVGCHHRGLAAASKTNFNISELL